MREQEIEALKKEQEKHRKQMQENREKVLARKNRTHRLIVRGAIAEALMEEPEKMTDAEFQRELYRMARKQDPRGEP